MKKLPILLLSASLLFACNSKPGDTEQSPSTTVEKKQMPKPVSQNAVVITAKNWPETNGGIAIDANVEKRVDDLLAKLSNREKVGQIVQADMGAITVDEVREYRLGSVLAGGNSAPNGKPYANVADWIASSDGYWDALMQDRGDGSINIPPLLGIDAVHGHNNVIGGTIFPHNIALGAMNDPELIKRVAEVTAKELVVTGHDWTFAPTLAVARDDRWGRTYESYSEAPEIVASYAPQVVLGLQGSAAENNLFGDGKVISTAKHFIGDGGTDKGIDQGNNIDYEADLRDIHGAGYPPAVEAGVQSIMASFSSWQGEKLHGHKALMNDVLKERMNFNGFIVGDWNAHGSVTGCTNTNCPTALTSGLDMYMAPDSWKGLFESLLTQVEDGTIPESRLDDAVRRILRVKVRSGLMDKPKPSLRKFGGDESVLGRSEHKEVAREAVRKSLVLLKNNGALPLNPKANILVAGSGADSIAQAAGGWSLTWQGVDVKNSEYPNAQSIYSGIKQTVEAAGGVSTLNTEGNYQEKPDVAIVVFGEKPYAEFMGDVDHVGYDIFSNKEINLLKKLKADSIPVVSIFLSGRPMWVNPELNASDAFVAAWLPGTEAGAIADVIFTKPDGSIANDFVGKLSFSWPKNAAQTPLNRDDKEYDPLFAYGYGLSYKDKENYKMLSEETGLSSDAIFDPNIFFVNGKPQAPLKLYTVSGSTDDWRDVGQKVRVTDGTINLSRVDYKAQEDSWKVDWFGQALGQVFIANQETELDYSRQNTGALELAFELQVFEAGDQPIYLAWGCGIESDECIGEIDISNTINAQAKGEWKTIRTSLKCFADAGADVAKTKIPFLLKTSGKASLAFAEVRLDSDQDGKMTCPN